jgi:hypothetical protein
MVSSPEVSLEAVRWARSRVPSPLGEKGFGAAWTVTLGAAATLTDMRSRVLVAPSTAVARTTARLPCPLPYQVAVQPSDPS